MVIYYFHNLLSFEGENIKKNIDKTQYLVLLFIDFICASEQIITTPSVITVPHTKYHSLFHKAGCNVRILTKNNVVTTLL